MADKQLKIVITAEDLASPKVQNLKKILHSLGLTPEVAGPKEKQSAFSRMLGTPADVATGVLAAGLVRRAFSAVTGGIRDTIKTGAEFEYSMSRVAALTGATGGDFDSLRQRAIEMGAATVFTASQSAEAMGFFALAGFDTAKILKSIKPTLDLAAAGQLGIGQAADISAKIMAGFGLTADQLGPKVDVLAKAFTTSNTDLTMLGDAMKYVGPIARSAGMGFEETTAAVMMLSNAGIQGEMAGTTLRGVILSLANPTADAKAELDKLGITVRDQRGNFLPLVNIIGQFQEKLAGMGSADRLRILGEVFEKRGGAGFAALLDQGPEQLAKFTASLGDAAGTAERIAGVQLNNLKGDFEQLAGAAESLKIALESSVDSPLRRIVRSATDAVNVLTMLMQVRDANARTEGKPAPASNAASPGWDRMARVADFLSGGGYSPLQLYLNLQQSQSQNLSLEEAMKATGTGSALAQMKQGERLMRERMAASGMLPEGEAAKARTITAGNAIDMLLSGDDGKTTEALKKRMQKTDDRTPLEKLFDERQEIGRLLDGLQFQSRFADEEHKKRALEGIGIAQKLLDLTLLDVQAEERKANLKARTLEYTEAEKRIVERGKIGEALASIDTERYRLKDLAADPSKAGSYNAGAILAVREAGGVFASERARLGEIAFGTDADEAQRRAAMAKIAELDALTARGKGRALEDYARGKSGGVASLPTLQSSRFLTGVAEGGRERIARESIQVQKDQLTELRKVVAAAEATAKAIEDGLANAFFLSPAGL